MWYQYSLTSVVLFLSLFCGVYLARNSPEEMGGGTRYFLLAKKLLLVVLLVMLVVLGFDSLYLSAFAIIMLIMSIFVKKYADQVFFLIFALLLLLSLESERAFLLVSIVVFIYGLIAGTLFAASKEKEGIGILIKKTAINFVWFLILFNLPLAFGYA